MQGFPLEAGLHGSIEFREGPDGRDGHLWHFATQFKTQKTKIKHSFKDLTGAMLGQQHYPRIEVQVEGFSKRFAWGPKPRPSTEDQVAAMVMPPPPPPPPGANRTDQTLSSNVLQGRFVAILPYPP